VKKRKLPRDANQRAKMIVDMTLHEDEPEPPARVKDAASVELGRLGGLIGGKRRAEKLSPERRSEIARKAAAARWGKE
jgi:hypothetical protein